MVCSGCGAPSVASDVLCGGCGNTQRHASADDVRPAKAVFHLGQAMQQQALPASSTGWRWGALALALIALALCVFMAVT